MKQDIHTRTFLILRKNRLYLVGYDALVHKPKWSQDCYDAWRTKDVEKARKVAAKTGADILLFNPLLSQIKPFEIGG